MSPEKKPAKRRRKKAEQESRGLTAKQVGGGEPPAEIQKVMATIGDDGGTVIGAYRDPLGGNWQVIAALPLAKVEPTPYQRDLSETHVAKLAKGAGFDVAAEWVDEEWPFSETLLRVV